MVLHFTFVNRHPLNTTFQLRREKLCKHFQASPYTINFALFTGAFCILFSALQLPLYSQLTCVLERSRKLIKEIWGSQAIGTFSVPQCFVWKGNLRFFTPCIYLAKDFRKMRWNVFGVMLLRTTQDRHQYTLGNLCIVSKKGLSFPTLPDRSFPPKTFFCVLELDWLYFRQGSL